MNKEELVEFLKEQLKVELIDDGKYLTVKILLGDETISESTEDIYR